VEATAGAGAAPARAPHWVQKRLPGVNSEPHWVQWRAARDAPHEAQKFPVPDAPHWGQVTGSLMASRGLGARRSAPDGP
jgi:hypothetical protein